MGQEIQFDDVQGRNKGASRLIKNSIGVNLFGKYNFFRLFKTKRPFSRTKWLFYYIEYHQTSFQHLFCKKRNNFNKLFNF